MTRAPLLLSGCQPEPLASYLKALGVLRLVATQVDPGATGHWSTDGFVLTSGLDLDSLVEFFTVFYVPTPVVSPWNGGSGFHPKDNPDGIGPIEASTDARFAGYRETIAIGRQVLREIPESKDQKPLIVQACRSQLPDNALPWIDAAAVLLDGALAYPPLLGTGGNDGRLDFSNNFMQRLVLLMGLGGAKAPKGSSLETWLVGALTGASARGIKASIGQFAPGASGGPNSGAMAAADSISNPADFVLLVEGAMVVAAACTKRLGTGLSSYSGSAPGPKRAAMPFTFAATPVGYASAVEGEDGRGELWLPLWNRPARFAEVARLFGEGRCSWAGKTARSGLDAARAAVTLGVDRGIESFTRCALVTRNGLATAAIPVGRIVVAERPDVGVLAALDGWLDLVRRGKNPPNALAPALAGVERAMFRAAATGSAPDLLAVLSAAAALDGVVATATTFRACTGPLLLPVARWARTISAAAAEPAGGLEVRLAAGFASLRGRGPGQGQAIAELVRPIRREGRRAEWTERSVVAGLGRRSLAEVLADVHGRRWMAAGQGKGTGAPEEPTPAFDLGTWVGGADVVSLVTGRVDPQRLEDLIRGLLLLDWSFAAPRLPLAPRASISPALAVLAPAFGPLDGIPPESVLQAQPGWVAMLSRRSAAATGEVLTDAVRRVRMAGWRPLVSPAGVALGAPDGSSLAAALLLKLAPSHRRDLLEQVAARTENDLAENQQGEEG